MGRVLYSCGLFLTILAIGTSVCPSKYKPGRGTCYRLAENILTWGDAQNACAGDELESALVTISSQEKLRDVMSFLVSQSAKHAGYWLYGNDCLVEGKFVWHNVPGTNPIIGTNIDPDPKQIAPAESLWCGGKPQMDKTRNCLRLTGTCFEDEACGTKLGIICETPPLSTRLVSLSEILFSSPKYAVGSLY